MGLQRVIIFPKDGVISVVENPDEIVHVVKEGVQHGDMSLIAAAIFVDGEDTILRAVVNPDIVRPSSVGPSNRYQFSESGAKRFAMRTSDDREYPALMDHLERSGMLRVEPANFDTIGVFMCE